MTLDGECDRFARCVIGLPAAVDVRAAYVKAHDLGVIDPSRATPLDRALLQVAHVSPSLTRMADSLAALIAPGGLLRQKIVLLSAILESRGDSSRVIDTAVSGSRAAWCLSVAVAGLGSAVRAVAALVLVVPCWAWYRLR